MILSADWHLVDTPSEEYRWDAFNQMRQFAIDTDDKDLFILGDLVDRKDRHSGAFVHRVRRELLALVRDKFRVTIILGNHDQPVVGKPYWTTLNGLDDNLWILDEPEYIYTLDERKQIFLFPYTADPATKWASFFADADALVNPIAFIHQPVDGAKLESGQRYSGASPLPFPKSFRVFAGDIHTPQRVGNVTYVGAPHPVKFGDSYTCRMLRIDDWTGKIIEERILHPPAKASITVSCIASLASRHDAHGGQAKIVWELAPEKVDDWPHIQALVAGWAKTHDVKIVSLEPRLSMGPTEKNTLIPGLSADPAEILTAYAKAKGLPDAIFAEGMRILKRELANATD